jgi:hypothetical protein
MANLDSNPADIIAHDGTASHDEKWADSPREAFADIIHALVSLMSGQTSRSHLHCQP